MSKDKSLAAKVEEQSGRCRQLGVDLYHHAETAPLLVDSERDFLRHLADSIVDIADGLTVALRDKDGSRLRRFWQLSGAAAGVVVVASTTGTFTGIATGASQAAIEHHLNRPSLEQQAHAVVDAEIPEIPDSGDGTEWMERAQEAMSIAQISFDGVVHREGVGSVHLSGLFYSDPDIQGINPVVRMEISGDDRMAVDPRFVGLVESELVKVGFLQVAVGHSGANTTIEAKVPLTR